MHALTSRTLIALVLAGLAIGGCEDGGPPPSDPDAGPEDDAWAPDAGDVTAPTVVATSPVDGASLVPIDTAIVIAFSEAMDVTAGRVVAASDDGAIDLGEPRWSADRTTLTIAPTSSLPTGATILVTVGSTFVDASGNALFPAHTFEFATEDPIAPTIVRTAPADGATDVDVGLATIELELSEPMRVASGVARIEGPGEPALGAISWLDRVASWTVSGLRADSTYRVTFEGFEDLAGNALDTGALGADGALELTTGPDVTAPVVLDSTPHEGQLDVDVGLVAQVAIELSEPMDTSVGAFALEVGGDSVALEPRWDRGGTRVLLDVSGRLAASAAHRIAITDLRDLAGNPLDGTTYLVDGALDFTTGSDLFVPFVAFTSPEEGSSDTAGGVLEIVVVFSEAMDASTVGAPLTGDDRTVTLSGTWSSGDTVLTLEAPTLQAGRSYDLDLRGFRDAGGTPVDATHAYLGDGIASFTLEAPRGEVCGDALTETEASSTGAGFAEWVIASGAVTRADGSAPCDPDGHGPDVLVRFRKTTAAARDGGSALHVVVTPETSSHNLDVDILAGDCRASAPVADAARMRCLVERTRWEQWLDVGPGDYYVWIARDGSPTFTGATVRVEEVPAVRDGESCDAPLDVGSPGAIYTAPTVVGTPHRWELPAGYSDAMDRARTASDPIGAVSCLPAGSSLGHDAVVELDKASGTSLVTVRVTMPLVSGRHGAVEIARGCQPGDATRTEVACLPYSASAIDREVTFDGPPGPISTWIVERRSAPLPAGAWGDTPATTIEITEFEPMAGDSCATAIPLTPAIVNTVTATRPWRAHVPACLATGGVTWFRYVPTRGLGIVRADGSTLGAVVDRVTGRVLRCMGDDTTNGVPVFGVPGEEVCVALSSSAAVSQITIEELSYSGVRGTASGFDVEVPSGVSSPSTLAWMAVLGGNLYRAGFGRIQTVPTTGGPLSQQSFSGLTVDGGGAVERPDGLYVLSSSSSATSGPRVFRVTDSTGAFLPVPVPLEVLPPGFEYPDRAFDAMTWDGTQFIAVTGQGSTLHTSPLCCTPVRFYAIPADGSVPVELGTNDVIDDVSGIAADATYLYLTGRISTGTIVGGLSHYDEAIHRLRRDQLTDPLQPPAVLLSGYDLSTNNGPLYVDDTTNADALYVRPYGNGADVLLIVEPDADAPAWVGPLWRSGETPGNVTGLAYDPGGPTLWLYDTAPFPRRWVRLD